MIRHFTTEAVHSGLSALGRDNKWSDMLNFRSFNNSTKVVTPKSRLVLADGIHTLANGPTGLNYAIGSKGSFGFRVNQNEAITFPLWSAKVTPVGVLDDRPSGKSLLKIRGNYEGNSRLQLKLSYNNGGVVLAGPPVQLPEIPDVDIIPEPFTVSGTVLDIDTDEPIPGVRVTWKLDGAIVQEVVTDEVGTYELLLTTGQYEVTFHVLGYQFKTETKEVSETSLLFIDYLDSEFVALYTGVKIYVRYSNTLGPVPGGHTCDSAIYKVLGNNLFLGHANLNNGDDGGDRETIITITPEQAAELAGVNNNPILDLSLECDPTHPEYDHDSVWGDTCHTSLAWVIVEDAEGNELYNDAPSGYFLTLDLSAP